MKLEIKTIDNKQKALIVANKKTFFVSLLKQHLEKLGSDIYFSSSLLKTSQSFDISFLVNEKNFKKIGKKPTSKFIFIFINEERLALRCAHHFQNKVKIISIQGNTFNDNDIDKMLWFSMSNTKEMFLRLSIKQITKSTNKLFSHPIYDVKKIFRPKFVISAFVILFFFFQTVFIIPLAVTSYLSYNTYLNFKKENFSQATDSLHWQKNFLQLTKNSYVMVQSLLLFLSIANFPDDLIEINEKTGLIFEKILISQKGANNILSLIAKKDKTNDEKNLLSLRINRLKTDLDEITDNLTVISNKLPGNLPKINNVKKTIVSGLDLVGQLKKIIPFFDEIMAKNDEKHYLLLFANNMELRPGGGFIGSFGILTTKDYTLDNIKVYDVYDADGQLKAHIEPPTAIRDYLKQPHWFLRDSAFSPDFLENYSQAKFFLDKELSLNNFSGAILITTSAIENILQGFGNIYLSDFKEIVNSKNFYLKAQYYAEKNFFPGSIQKKTFLSTLLQQILLSLNHVSAKDVITGIKKSLDEKQLVVFIDNQEIQSIFESLFWSGRVIKPQCINDNQNCLNDYIMPIDANLGINKANFFVSRLITLKTNFNDYGQINHSLSVVFKNESQSDVFPGGSYKNYFQVYIPQNTTIQSITKNGVLVDQKEIDNQFGDDWFRVIGIFFEVKPKSSTEIKINYQLTNRFKNGQGTYQLVVQKQIGSANNDFVSEIYLTKKYSLISQNFIPLVKDNQILYNTYLSTDKIFFVELVKE